MHSLTLLKKQVALFTNLIKKTLTLGKKKLRTIMKPTTDNSKMPDSETFKERFLATAKNKDDILKVLNENKDNLISNNTLNNP